MTTNISVITPSWLVKSKKELSSAVKTLKNLGFVLKGSQYKTKLLSPKLKAQQIHNAFKDPNCDVILAQRGGYSAIKILPFINFNLIKKHHKFFAGFSDLSALLNNIYERSGFSTYHCPMLFNFSNPTKFTISSFMNALNGFPEPNLLKGAPVRVYRHGKAMGVLKGGNLVTLTSLLSTKWDISYNNSIVFLEDVDEELHRIDRCLTQWILSGKLSKTRALILGDFRGVKSLDVFKVLSSQMKINFPVIYCPYIGHVKNKITLPVGARVSIDTYKKELLVQKIFK